LGPRELKGVTTHALPHLNKKYKYIYIYIYIYINICFYSHVKRRNKKEKKKGGAQSHGPTLEFALLAALQDKGDCQSNFLGYLRKMGNVLNRQQAQVNQDVGLRRDLPR
jgi:hypothetical protein